MVEVFGVQAKRFTNDSFDPIAIDCPPDVALRYSDTEPRVADGAARKIDVEVPGTELQAGAEQAEKKDTSAKPGFSWETVDRSTPV